jgi:hypothetical protein
MLATYCLAGGACGGGGLGRYSGPFLPQAGTTPMAEISKTNSIILRKIRILSGPGDLVMRYGKLIL